MPQPKPRLVVAASSIQGVGVHTQDSVEPGTPLFAVRGVRRSEDYDERFDKGAHWFSLGTRLWIEPGPRTLPRFLNHSCAPTAVWGDDRWVTARVRIPAGGEISIDYGTIELDPFWRMPCSCGAPTCRRTIVPFYLEPARVRRKLEPQAPAFLRACLSECLALVALAAPR
jgi:hypothetical protein